MKTIGIFPNTSKSGWSEITKRILEFADAGGAIAYGPEEISTWERIADLVAKTLSGAKPGNLPIDRPTKFQLVVNIKTAKALGLTIPQSILVRADEVIR